MFPEPLQGINYKWKSEIERGKNNFHTGEGCQTPP